MPKKLDAPTALDLYDALADLLAGIEHWKDAKVSACEWDTHDEMLARWVEASPAAKLMRE